MIEDACFKTFMGITLLTLYVLYIHGIVSAPVSFNIDKQHNDFSSKTSCRRRNPRIAHSGHHLLVAMVHLQPHINLPQPHQEVSGRRQGNICSRVSFMGKGKKYTWFLFEVEIPKLHSCVAFAQSDSTILLQ